VRKATLSLFLSLLVVFSTHGAQTQSQPQSQEPTRTIEVHAQRFSFVPDSITVHRGETVRLQLISDDVPHSLLIEPLGINEAASKSHPGEAVFTANQTGDFAGRCGRFCGSGHGKMLFTVHVTGN
jgi:cytochrome c oxidase subunit II